MLIKNINIVTLNEDEFIENTNLYIKEDKIYHIGDLLDDYKVDKVIDGRGKLLMPGLINSHTHVAMSLLRNYADDYPLMEWLTEKIWPMEAKFTGEDIYWFSLLSMVEMIKSGTTTFCDMYFEMDRVAQGVEESGMRAVLTQGMIEDEKKDEKLKISEKLFKDWHGKANGRITTMLAPHAPYTCGTDYLLQIKELADSLGTGIHIHLSETEGEVRDSYEKHGKSPVKYLRDLGILDGHVLAAHCVHVDNEDMEVLREKNVYPVYNPTSNLKLASGFAPVDSMLKMGIKVALGTDGSSSNNNLNMFEEIHIGSIVNKALNKDATSVRALDALKMATTHGAEALNLDKIGMVKEGYKADLILLNFDSVHLQPKSNPIASLVYSCQGSDVETVIVDGKLIMEDRKVKTLDEGLIISKVNKIKSRLIEE